VSDLGFIVDAQLNTSDHVAQVCRSHYFQLQQLRHVRCSLTPDAVKTLVHAFISCRLDYCNSFLTGVYNGVLRKLSQSKMPLLVWLPTHGNSTTLHLCCAICIGLWSTNEWCLKLPCWFTSVGVVWHLHIWVSFVDGFQLFRAVGNYGLAPPAFFTSQEQRLWSTGPVVVAGTVTWHSLPAELRTLKLSVLSFAKRLKTYLFNSYWLQPAAQLLLPRF